MAVYGYDFPGLDSRIDDAAKKAEAAIVLPEHMRDGAKIHLDRLVARREEQIRKLGQETLFSIEEMEVA